MKTTRLRGRLTSFVAVLVLAWAGLVLAQNSPGGAFLTNFDYILDTPNGWMWRTLTPWRIEGAVDNAFETTITFTEPTADRTITFQNATGTVALAAAATSGAMEAGATNLDGSNPTSVTTNLSVLAGCTVQTNTEDAPGLSPIVFTTLVTATAGRLDIYAWAATSNSNPTMIASTSTRNVRYVCIGTR